MNEAIDPIATSIAHEFGASTCTRLGVGAQAVAFALGNTSVLKIYFSADGAERLDTLRDFYRRLNVCDVGFAVPKITTIGRRGEWVFSIESRLPGAPLGHRNGYLSDDQLIESYLDTALNLQKVDVSPAWGRWTMLGREPQQGDWHEFIRTLLKQKMDTLTFALPHECWARLSDSAASVLERFEAPFSGEVSLIHGDLHPGNILVDSVGSVTAVIDFGAFTMFGDAAYDAATACGYFSMYEPDQAVTRHRLIERLLRLRGSPSPESIATYLRLAALLTCDAYPDPRLPIHETGHFRWAMSILFDPVLDELAGASR